MNDHSSRSHALFRVQIESRETTAWPGDDGTAPPTDHLHAPPSAAVAAALNEVCDRD